MRQLVSLVALGAFAWVTFGSPRLAQAAKVMNMDGSGQEIHAGPEPANAAAYHQGLRALADNDVESALSAFRMCITPNRRGAKCYRGLAAAYGLKGLPALAAPTYRNYLKYMPNAADAGTVKKLIRDADAAAQQQASNAAAAGNAY